MKQVLLLIATICTLLIGQVYGASCRLDSCASQVFASRSSSQVRSTRRADCSSFLRVTVTPATRTYTRTKTVTGTKKKTITVQTRRTSVTKTVNTVTETVKTTVTAAALDNRNLHDDGHGQRLEDRRAGPRAVTTQPTKVPSYASACNTSRYSSACSCLGVRLTTTTKPTPIRSVTVTKTITPTVKVTATKTITVPRTATTRVTQTSTVPHPEPEEPEEPEEPAPLPQCAGSGLRGTETNSCECCWEIKSSPQPDFTKPRLEGKNAPNAEGCIKHCDALKECQTFFYFAYGSGNSGFCFLYATGNPQLGFSAETMPMGRKTSQECRRQQCNLPIDEPPTDPPRCESNVARGDGTCGCCYGAPKKTRRPIFEEATLFRELDVYEAGDCARLCDANESCLSFFHSASNGECQGYAKQYPRLFEHSSNTVTRGLRTEESCVQSTCDVSSQEEPPTELPECRQDSLQRGAADCGCCYRRSGLRYAPDPDARVLMPSFTADEYRECRETCDKREDCRSYAWHSATHECRLYPSPVIREANDGTFGYWESGERVEEESCTSSECSPPSHPECEPQTGPRRYGTCQCCYKTEYTDSATAATSGTSIGKYVALEFCIEQCDDRESCKRTFYNVRTGDCYVHENLDAELTEPVEYLYFVSGRTRQNCIEDSCTIA